MSANNFELHAKADEWMDITPKEELLQAELDRMKEAFEKCSTQLDAYRLENDLLKDHKAALENEAEDLKSSLLISQQALNKAQIEWKNTQTEHSAAQKESKETIAELRAAVAHREDLIAQAKSEVREQQQMYHKLQQQHSAETKQSQQTISKLTEENKMLHSKLSNLQQDNKQQHETIARFYKELEQSRNKEERLSKELDGAKRMNAEQQKQIEEHKKTTGTIATLAEKLKIEKQDLARSMTTVQKQSQEYKQHAEQQIRLLQGDVDAMRVELDELERSKSSSSVRMGELQAVIQALQSDVEQKEEEVQSLASKLAVATEENSTLSGEREELSAHLTRMEAGRHDLLEQKSELEESLDETFRDLEAANERLHELEETLEATRIELDVLLASKETYQHAADREAALELQLREQHLAFEERLNEIRNILGLKFTAVISSEVQHKFRNVEMPMSFRVPLLTTKIV